MSCDNCHKSNLPLRKCAKCGTVAYCSLECQRADWRAGHKNTCGKADTFQQLNASAQAGDKAEMMKLMSQLLSNRAAQEQAGGHGHSHGGKPCHGHGQEEPEEDDHGHAHEGGGHGHGHGGPTQIAAAAAQGHGHSHGGKPCHGHGAEPAPAPAPQAHGHSHGGKPCHGHGAEPEPADHGHAHGGHGGPNHVHGPDCDHDDAGDTHQHGYARQRARLAEKAKKQAHAHAGDVGHGHSHGGQPCHGHGGADDDDETETTLEFFAEELEKQKLYQPLIHCEQKGNTTSDVPSYPRPTLTPVTVDATSPFAAALSELQVGSTHFSAATDTPTIYHLTYPTTANTVSLIPSRQTFLRLVPDVPLNTKDKEEDAESSPLDAEGMNAHIRQGACHICQFQSAPVQMRQGISQHMSSAQHIIRTYQTRMTSGNPAVVMEMHTFQMPITTLIPSIEALLPKVEEEKQEGTDAVVEGTMSKSALKKKKQKAKAKAADSDKPATTSTPEPSSAPSITKAPKKKKKEITVIQLIARIPGGSTYYAYEFVSTTDRLRTPLSLFHTIFDFTLSDLTTQHNINITPSSQIHVFTDRTEWTGMVSTNTMKFIELEAGRARTTGTPPAEVDQIRRNLLQKYHDTLKKEHTMSNIVLKQLRTSWSLSSLSTFILPYGHTQDLYRSWASIPTHEIQRYLII